MASKNNTDLIIEIHEKVGMLVQSDVDQTRRLGAIEQKIDAMPCQKAMLERAEIRADLSEHKRSVAAHPAGFFLDIIKGLLNGKKA